MSKSNSLLALFRMEKSLGDAACPDWLIWSRMADGPPFTLLISDVHHFLYFTVGLFLNLISLLVSFFRV